MGMVSGQHLDAHSRTIAAERIKSCPLKTPTLTLANPITCEPGLTGETGNMMFPCIVRVVDGKVVELIINTQTGLPREGCRAGVESSTPVAMSMSFLYTYPDSLPSRFDAAVVIPTTLRPTLARAIESVYAQRFTGTIQILIGLDRFDYEAFRMIDASYRSRPQTVG